MSRSGTLFCGKANRHILFILQNIERRDLIANYFGPPQCVCVVVVVVVSVCVCGGGGGVCVCVCVCVCVGGGGGGGGGGGSLRRFIHFYLRKKLGTRIPWKELGLLLFKYCLQNGSNFPMNMSVFR